MENYQTKLENQIAEYRKALEQKIMFLDKVTPVLDAYAKSNTIFTTWRLGCDAFGSAFNMERSGWTWKRNPEAVKQADKLSAQIGVFLCDLEERGVIRSLNRELCNPSACKVYQFRS